MTDDLHRDRLSPANIRRRDADLDVPRIEPGSDQLRANPVTDYGVIFATLSGDPSSDRGCRLLPDPDVNQPPELDNAKQYRQQDERYRQHRLERFLPALTVLAGPDHDVCVSR
jgi:hypothetical protein